MVGGGALRGEGVEHAPRRRGTALGNGLTDRGQPEQAGQIVVVEADERDVLGIRIPVSLANRIAPKAISSLMANTAVGRSGNDQRRRMASAPPSMVNDPETSS